MCYIVLNMIRFKEERS